MRRLKSEAWKVRKESENKKSSRSFLVLFALIAFGLFPAINAQEVATLDINPATGIFSLSIPVETNASVVFAGTKSPNGNFAGTIQMSGGTQIFSINVTQGTNGANVNIGYGTIGVLDYFVPEQGEPMILTTSFGPAQCSTLFADPLFAEIRKGFFQLMVKNRQWESAAQNVFVHNVLLKMSEYIFGPRAISDCEEMAEVLDKKGCDIDPFGIPIISCSPKGTCCDKHDECYRINFCNERSWYETWDVIDPGPLSTLPGVFVGKDGPCAKCNQEAAKCFADLTTWGRSECCKDHTCGDPQSPAGSIQFPVLIRSGF